MAINYFNDEKAMALLARLERLTASGALTWVSGSSDYYFGCTVGEYGFSIESRDKDDLAPHILGVFIEGDDGHNTLQVIDSSDEIAPQAATAMERLYDLVKRKTVGADRIADDILDTLDRVESDDLPF